MTEVMNENFPPILRGPRIKLQSRFVEEVHNITFCNSLTTDTYYVA